MQMEFYGPNLHGPTGDALRAQKYDHAWSMGLALAVVQSPRLNLWP